MSEIKAIDTVYRGFKFRSRLEARWAVYMDLCDIRWEYEPEGYELPSGRYLPDFYIPAYKSFLEVKPASFTIDPKSREIRLLEELVEGSLRGAVLVAGDPCEFKEYHERPRPYDEMDDDFRCGYREEVHYAGHFELMNVVSWVLEKVAATSDLAGFDAAFPTVDDYHEAARDFLASHNFVLQDDGSMQKDGMLCEDEFSRTGEQIAWACPSRQLWLPFDFFGDPREALTNILASDAAKPGALALALKKHRETHGLKARQARFEHGQSGAV